MKIITAAILSILLLSGNVALAQNFDATGEAMSRNGASQARSRAVNPSDPQDRSGFSNPQDMTLPRASNPQVLVPPSASQSPSVAPPIR